MIQTIYAENGNFLTQAEAEAWAEGPAARDLLTRTAAWRPGYEIAWDTLRRTIWFFKFNPDCPSAINGWRQLTWIVHVEVVVRRSQAA